jgi:CheY-like chemotaxis protein
MKKILLLNNQEAFLDRNKSLLNRAGFQILTATSASEALQICHEQTVALVIAQLDLPETGGDQFCALVRQESSLRNVSIILVCYDSEAALARASNCGANAVVTRPIRPEILLRLVGRFLGIQARRDYRAVLNARIAGARENQVFSGVTRNISVSGLLCESGMELHQDDLLSNLLFSVDSSQIVANGQVVWTSDAADGQYSYGIRFLDLAQELQEKIEQFVSGTDSDN